MSGARIAGLTAAPPAFCSTESSSAVIPPARSNAPLTSRGSGRVARLSIIFVATSTKAITPSGRLIEKIERQPKVTVRNGPENGPGQAGHAPDAR